VSNNRDKGWIAQGIRKSCQQKRSLCIISKNSDYLMIKMRYKKYCSILKGVFIEPKKVYFKQLTETSEKRQNHVGYYK
jgi:ribosomal protein S18